MKRVDATSFLFKPTKATMQLKMVCARTYAYLLVDVCMNILFLIICPTFNAMYALLVIVWPLLLYPHLHAIGTPVSTEISCLTKIIFIIIFFSYSIWYTEKKDNKGTAFHVEKKRGL